MTKEQKFEARLTEMGLLNEWNKQGRCGRVATTDANGNIILFVHEDETDAYSEIHYPPFEELRTKYGFVKNCILEWKGFDAMFECKLDAWLGGVEDSPCPLDPVDAYFPASAFQTFYEDFEDDNDFEFKDGTSDELATALHSVAHSLPVFVEDENGRCEQITHMWYDEARDMIRLTISGVEFHDSED